MSGSPGRRVGVLLLGHGRTASEMLAAAKGIVGEDALAGVVAVDAGAGETPRLGPQLCETIARVDEGAGVLVLVDLLGASPCSCAQREATATRHDIATLSGLNLAMLLKLAVADRVALELSEVAEACADSGRRAVRVQSASPPAQEEQR